MLLDREDHIGHRYLFIPSNQALVAGPPDELIQADSNCVSYLLQDFSIQP